MLKSTKQSYSHDTRGEIAVWICFLLSGFAGLLYETVWLRYFSIAFGTTQIATGMVLAAYMAGLALGAALGGMISSRIRRPVLFYGLIELLVGVSALAVPWGLDLIQTLLVELFGVQPELNSQHKALHGVCFFVGGFLLLVIPTGLMGATLPVLSRQIAPDPDQAGRRVGILYAINTLGAVAGTITAAFILVPRFGLHITLVIGVVINFAIFMVAWIGLRKLPLPATPLAAQVKKVDGIAQPSISTPYRWTIFVLVAGSGALSFIYEILWSRLLGHVLGGSLQGFATMLASFLLGIAGGSMLASGLARNRKASMLGLVISQAAAGLTAIVVYISIDGLPELRALLFKGNEFSVAGLAIPAMLVLLPSAVCLGATFPFALSVLTYHDGGVGRSVGWTYACNTVGAICGALAASYLLLPLLGFTGTVRLSVAGNLILSVVALSLIPFRRRVMTLALLSVVLFVVIFTYRPSPPSALLRTSFFPSMKSNGKTLFFSTGKAASVLVLDQDGLLEFRTNGLPEASVLCKGDIASRNAPEFWLTGLASLARPEIDSMLVIGLGGGSALEDIPRNVKKVDVLEIEPRVVDANRAVSELRLQDPLADDRVKLHLGDGRNALSFTNKQYDAIVSQPSHPWTGAASHLYTREFFQAVQGRLTDEGVFVQWIEASVTNRELFEALVATVRSVFQNVRVYSPDRSMLLFIASDAPINIEQALIGAGDNLLPHPWPRYGMHFIEDLAIRLVLDEFSVDTIARDTAIITDDKNLFGTHSQQALAESHRENWAIDFFKQYDPLVMPESDFWRETGNHLDKILILKRITISDPMKDRPELVINRLQNNVDDFDGFNSLAQGIIGLERQRFSDAVVHLENASKSNDQTLNNKAHFLSVLSQLQEMLYNPDESTVALVERQFEEIKASLTTDEINLCKIFLSGIREDWTIVQSKDAELAALSPDNPGFNGAFELRIKWRLMIEASDQERQLYAKEIISLLDENPYIFRRPNSLLFRVRAGISAEEPDIVIATFWQIVGLLEHPERHTNPKLRGPSAVIARSAISLMKQAKKLSGINKAELDEIDQRLNTVYTFLQFGQINTNFGSR